MAPPVWLPFALKAGSMVSSGIGNYLEGKNQEKYYNRVSKMQQDAERRRREAERKAGMANIFLGLGGRTPMQPVYQEEPEIDPYESSGAGKLLRGLGTGLNYASTAVSAYGTIRDTMIAQAQQSGAKAGLGAYTNAVAEARPAVTSGATLSRALPGESVIDPGVINPEFNPVGHYSDVLTSLNNSKPASSGLFSGLFAKERQEAYDLGYSTSIGNLQSNVQNNLVSSIESQRAFDFQQAEFAEKKAIREAAQRRAKLAEEEAKKRLGIEVEQNAQNMVSDLNGDIADYILKSSSITKNQEAGLKYENILKRVVDLTKQYIDYNPETKEFVLKEGVDSINSIDAFTMDLLIRPIMRISSDEALNVDDMARLREMMGGFVDTTTMEAANFQLGLTKLFETKDTTSDVYKQLILPKNFIAALNILDKERQHKFGLVQNEIEDIIALNLTDFAGEYTDLTGSTYPKVNILGYDTIDAAIQGITTEHFRVLDFNAAKNDLYGVVDITSNIGPKLNNILDNAPPEDELPLPVTITQMEWENAKNDLDQITTTTSRGSKVEGREYEVWLEKYPKFSEFPTNSNLWTGKEYGSPKINTRPFKYEKKGRARVKVYTASVYDNERGWIEDADMDVRVNSPQTKKLAEDFILHNMGYDLINYKTFEFGQNKTAERDRFAYTNHIKNIGAKLNTLDLNNLLIGKSVDAFQQTLLDSNYAWGTGQTYPGLTPEYDPNYYGPGTGNFSAQEGKSRFFGGFGFGPAYETATSVASQYAPVRGDYALGRYTRTGKFQRPPRQFRR